jgi:transposase
MLPCSIDEYVSLDNIVRFIDAFIDKEIEINSDLGNRCPVSEGRPGFTSNCLCKLLLYGYLNSISSSRKLENETKRNIEVIWLMHNQCPDHWTISNFRKENKELIRRIAIDFRRFLKANAYLSGKSISTDGTKIKANASRDTLSIGNINKRLEKAEQEIEKYLNQLSENDNVENEHEAMLETTQELKSKIEYYQKEIEKLEKQKTFLESLGVNSISLSDPSAKIMKTKEGFMPSYNVQATVDNDSHFITSCQVTDHPNDYYSLEENINTLQEELEVQPQKVIADAGYANEEQIQTLEEKGIDVIVPFPQESQSQKKQRKNGISFTYNQQTDTITCSQGETLYLTKRNYKQKNHYYKKYQCKSCSGCPKKHLCTKSKKGRCIYLRKDGQWLENHKKKMQTIEYKRQFKQRKSTVEHPFGTMKYYMGQIPIFLRGKEKVQIELDLYSTAYNLKHLFNISTVSRLLEELKQWNPTPILSNFLSNFLQKIYHPYLCLIPNKKKNSYYLFSE